MGRLFFPVSVLFISLSSLVGCASRAQPAASPSALDESWVPKDSTDVTLRSEETNNRKPKAGDDTAMSCHPNTQEKPMHGAIHAAVD